MAGQITLLAAELANDPEFLGYTGMSNQWVVATINALTYSKNKASLSSRELLEAIDSSALLALTGDKAVRVWGILAMESVDPFGIAAKVFIDAFGVGSDTITALVALRKYPVSRANVLGYPGQVKEGHVEMARAKLGA